MKIRKENYEDIYQLIVGDNKTQKEVAIYFGCSVARISQILKQLKKEKNANQTQSS